MATGTIQKDMVLLWENPNPSANFEPQTINLDLSGFSQISITATHWSNDLSYTTGHFIVGLSQQVMFSPSTTNRFYSMRNCSVSATGVQFFEGRGVHNTGINTDNAGCVPQKIYGIR